MIALMRGRGLGFGAVESRSLHLPYTRVKHPGPGFVSSAIVIKCTPCCLLMSTTTCLTCCSRIESNGVGILPRSFIDPD